jgi:hypothetical protein
MIKRIIWIVVALVVIGVFYVGYRTYDAGRTLSSGDVQTDDSRSRSTTPAASTPSTLPPNQTIVYPSANEPGGSGAATTTAPSTTTSTTGQIPPPGDTLGPNPPDGERFGGSGKYQLYRQGNLTYRLDTETGQSCIIYATDEEWRKPRVLKNACPRK